MAAAAPERDAMATEAAAFRSAVDDVIAAITAENWSEARKLLAIAELQFMKIPTEQRTGADSIRYREQLGNMAKTIDALQSSTTRSGDNRRLITTKMGF